MKRGDEIEIDIVDLDSKGDGRGTTKGEISLFVERFLEIEFEDEF